MNTTIDIYSGPPDRSDKQAFAAYVGEVMQAWVEGKRLQAAGYPVPITASGFRWQDLESAGFNWAYFDYRVSPSECPKKMRPWRGPEDLPAGPVIWLRSPDRHPRMVTFISGHQLGSVGLSIYWTETEKWEYSTDRVTWHKCEVEEKEPQ